MRGVEYTEELNNEQLRERSISDTMKAALKERQNSDSFSIGASASGGFGGVSASVSTAASWTNSQASRDTSASSMQALADSVSQASSNIRNMYSTVVVQVTQKEQEKVETRTVKNHNHAHALTILYYEILRQYKVKITPSFSKGLIFLKMKGLDAEFTDKLILSNFDIIKKNILEPSLVASIDLFQQINSGDKEKIKLIVGEASFLPEASTKISFLKVTLISTSTGQNFNIQVLIKFATSDIWFIYTMGDNKLQEFFSPYATNGNFYSTSDLDFLPAESVEKPPFGLDVQDIQKIGLFYSPAHASTNAGSLALDLSGVKIEYTTTNELVWEKIFDSSDNPNSSLFPFHLDNPRQSPPLLGYYKFKMWMLDVKMTTFHVNPPIRRTADIATSLNEYQKKAIDNIKEHINDNKTYYWRKVFLNRENNIYASEFDKITLTNNPTETLLDIATPIPINVIGDYLVFEIPDKENPYIEELKRKLGPKLLADVKSTDVSLPTRGVFAETKLSHCSAAEVIDETRFWKWHEAPDEVKAPEIAAIVTGSRSEQQNLTPSQMPNSNLTIINPAAAPDPGAGIAGGLSLLGSLGAFTQAQGDQQNVRATMQGNLDNVRRVAELNAQLEMHRRTQQNVDQTSDRIQRAVEGGRLTPEQGQRMQEQLHSNLVGGETSNNNNANQPDAVDNALNTGIQTGRDVEYSDNNKSISVKGGSSKQAVVVQPYENEVDILTGAVLTFRAGNITWQIEGGNSSSTLSLHHPTENSGVTIGAGYDMKSRTVAGIVRDLTNAGVSLAAATSLSAAAGLSGVDADNFVRNNNAQSWASITAVQRQSLFNNIYPTYTTRARSLATSSIPKSDANGNPINAAAVGAEFIVSTQAWDALNPAIKELLTDITYPGQYRGSRHEYINPILKDTTQSTLNKFRNLRLYIDSINNPPDDFLGTENRKNLRLGFIDDMINQLEVRYQNFMANLNTRLSGFPADSTERAELQRQISSIQNELDE